MRNDGGDGLLASVHADAHAHMHTHTRHMRERQRETETERDREAIKTVEYITFYGSSATELVAEYRPLLA